MRSNRRFDDLDHKSIRMWIKFPVQFFDAFFAVSFRRDFQRIEENVFRHIVHARDEGNGHPLADLVYIGFDFAMKRRGRLALKFLQGMKGAQTKEQSKQTAKYDQPNDKGALFLFRFFRHLV